MTEKDKKIKEELEYFLVLQNSMEKLQTHFQSITCELQDRVKSRLYVQISKLEELFELKRVEDFTLPFEVEFDKEPSRWSSRIDKNPIITGGAKEKEIRYKIPEDDLWEIEDFIRNSTTFEKS